MAYAMWDEFDKLMDSLDMSANTISAEEKLNIAITAVMLHIAHIDHEFHENEFKTIRHMLKDYFQYDDEHLDRLIDKADISASPEGFTEVESFIMTISTHLDDDKVRDFLKMIWRVIIADDVIHPNELNIANLLASRFHIGPIEHEKIKQSVLSERHQAPSKNTNNTAHTHHTSLSLEDE